MDKALANDPAIVSKLSALNLYDYVIVGSGIGGGILAEELAKNKQRVLLIERGGLVFSTHVCNTARPDFGRGTADAPEGNELVYAALKATVQTAEGSEPYVGGPLYCLGGRSNVWGLWTPRADDVTLDEFFPASITEYLKADGYDEVFNLMTNDSQKDFIYPTKELGVEVLDQAKTVLNEAISEYIVPGQDLHLGPIATQLISPAPYRFPQGAYSTTGPLLNRMYARDQYLTVLLETEVLEIVFPKENDTDVSQGSKVVKSLTIRSTTNGEVNHISTENAKVILSAGTLGTAKIALASGLQLYNPLVGKGLIDHEVWASRVAQERPAGVDPSTRQPILLQTMVNVDGRNALLSVTYNSNFFLAGSTRLSIRQYWNNKGHHLLDLRNGAKKIQETDFDTVAVLLEFHAELEDENEVLNIPSKDPVIRIKRRDAHIDEQFQLTMQDLGTKIRDSTLDLQHEPCASILAPRLSLLGLGVFAHEVGTMRMDGPKSKGKGVVDENLQVKGFSNLFVCDLSVFPVSTPANPTRTLAALSLRLAKFLLELNVDSKF